MHFLCGNLRGGHESQPFDLGGLFSWVLLWVSGRAKVSQRPIWPHRGVKIRCGIFLARIIRDYKGI